MFEKDKIPILIDDMGLTDNVTNKYLMTARNLYLKCESFIFRNLIIILTRQLFLSSQVK